MNFGKEKKKEISLASQRFNTCAHAFRSILNTRRAVCEIIFRAMCSV